jgi:branched-chain amino acid transport system permease protein
VSGYLGGVLAILALNVILAYSVFLSASVGIVNLGTAGFAAIGGYVAAYLSAQYGVSMPVATLAGAAAAAVTGFAVSFPILRTRGIYIVLATFAFGELVTSLIVNIDAVGGASGYPVIAYAPLGVLLATAVAVWAVVAFLFTTRFGLAMRALHDDESVAMLFGIDVAMTKACVLATGAFLAGIAGALYGFHYSYLEVGAFSDLYSIYILLYVLLGGVQTSWGPLVGALIFSVLPEALRGSNEWRYVIFGAAIVLLMMVRPEGLVTRTMLVRLRQRLRGTKAVPS